MSATLVRKSLDLLGLPADTQLSEYPSPFAPNRWPLIYIPGMRVIDSRMAPEEWAELVRRIDAIIATRLDRRIIIPSISYQRQSNIYEWSTYQHKMIIHSSRTTSEAVESYLAWPPPQVLVSPSVDTGWDFPDDACRTIIVPKHPHIDTRGAVEMLRDQQDPKYKHYAAAIRFTQSIGRAMRHALDWCETFLLDTISVEHMMNQHEFYPRYVHALLRRTTVIPNGRPNGPGI